jgi:signal transduction histidine kinase
MSDAVRALWDRWEEARGRSEPFGGRESETSRGRAVFMAWRGTDDRAIVLVGGALYLQQQIVEPLHSQVLEPRNAQIALVDGSGRTVVSPGAVASSPEPVVLSQDQTQLPWTLRVVSASSGSDAGRLVARQSLLIVGLALLALIVVAGTYFSARAVTREINAARLQSDFVAAVSHEFRTPLTLLRQFSDMLADERVASDDERRMYYAALQRGTRRLTRLVEDLLDFARMEAGSHAVRLERLRAREWLAGVVHDFAEESRNKGYQVDFEWQGPCAAEVHADESALTRALWNLLDNAVKYSPGCKTIWVHGEAGPDSVTVRVRDRGIGVPAAEQRAIFRKFVRGTVADGHVVKGTGLGLALVEQIVEAHGGAVQLESTLGEGSTFSIRLPARVDEADAVAGVTWSAS